MGGGHDEREQTLNQMLVEMDGFDPKVERHRHRGDEPPRHPRPGAAAPGPLRPPDRRRRPRPQGPQAHPRGARPRQAARRRRRPRGRRPQDPRLHRRRPRERAERGRAAHRPLERAADRQPRARRGHRPRDRRPAAPHARDEGQGEAHHGVPRGRSRARGGGDELHRPGHEGHDPPARQGPRLHDGAAARRQVLGHPQRAAGPARVRDGRPRRRGDHLPRPDHGRLERHREGDQHRPQDGHRVRHDDGRRPGQARLSPRARCSWAATWATAATSASASPSASTRRCAPSSSRRTTRPTRCINANRDVLDKLALELLEKETLDHLELAEIFADVKKLPPRPQWLSSEQRPSSQLPPVDVPAAPRPEPVAASVEAEQAAPEKAPKRRPTGQARPATA